MFIYLQHSIYTLYIYTYIYTHKQHNNRQDKARQDKTGQDRTRKEKKEGAMGETRLANFITSPMVLLIPTLFKRLPYSYLLFEA